MNDCKIMIIAPTAYTLGGVAVWLDYLMRGLTDKGVDVVFGAVNGNFHNASAYLKEYPFKNSLIINNPSGTGYGRVKSIKQAVAECNPQIIVSVNIPDVYCAARELKKTTHSQLRVVSTLHGLDENLFYDLEQYNDCIDAVVVTNKLTQIMVESFSKFNQERVFYAPYGVIEHSVRKPQLSNKPLRLLYAGRIDNEQKRCADIVKIITELEERNIDYHLTLVGGGLYKKTLLEGLFSVSDKSKICDLGILPASDMVEKAYTQSDVLLVTSEWETGPIVIWEAMACGMLVVTSRYNGLSAEGALVNEQNCLIFDVGDTKSAADKLGQIINSEISSIIVQNAYQLITRRYSRKASLDTWQATFKSISELETPAKKTLLRKNNYRIFGLLECIFGVRLATMLRPRINKPALINSAGSEWPHTHSNLDDTYRQRFAKTLTSLNKG